jgi:fused signal recognition particle receptor
LLWYTNELGLPKLAIHKIDENLRRYLVAHVPSTHITPCAWQLSIYFARNKEVTVSIIKNLFSKPIHKLKEVFQNSNLSIGQKLVAIFRKGLSTHTIEEIQELLYSTDLSAAIVEELVQDLKGFAYTHSNATQEQLQQFLSERLLRYLDPAGEEELAINHHDNEPHVIFIIGSNGYGKTTSVAKLAHYYKMQGKRVLLVAADTFRAAAVEQLQLWAQRVGVECVAGKSGGDPAAVIFDGITAGKARGAQVVLIDTAGRLHTKEPLLKELEKLYKTAGKVLPGAPHETLLVLDATTGKSALAQAKAFRLYAPITGLFVTKFDSTARAGAIITLQAELKLKTRWLGLGEGVEDMAPFIPEEFVHSLIQEE